MGWDVKQKSRIHDAAVFSLEEMHVDIEGQPHTYARILSNDWVNVLPITADHKAILIRQFRAGVLADTLEVPGGIIDPGEKDPTLAAARELEEETGYTSTRLLPLGSLNANPAIMNNKVHMFVALNCHPAMERQHFPDETEKISLELIDTKELELMVRTGRIDHSICALTIMLGMKYILSS